MNLRKNLVSKLICVLTVFTCIFTGFTVEAGEGNKKQPLSLVSSVPANDENNVKVSTDIKLTFSKNVVNMKVKEKNEKCFELKSSEGVSIPFDVIMADDQMEREKRNDIILKPKEELKEGTAYTVIVLPKLQSKSGVELGEEFKITFTTVGGSTAVDGNSVQSFDYKTIVIILSVLLIVLLSFYLKRRRETKR